MKTIYLIRHGESEYNVWRKKSLLNFTWLFVKDPMIYDAVLSKRGKQQVIQLKETLREMGLLKKINMVVTSPLKRALDTAIGAFEEVEFRVVADARERMDTKCDVGTGKEELSKLYEQLELGALKEVWWENENKESIQELDVRIDRLLDYLENMQGGLHIAVVCHSSIIKRMTNARFKVSNCAIQKVTLGDLRYLQKIRL